MKYILTIYFIILIIDNVYGYGYKVHEYMGKIVDDYILINEEKLKKKININFEDVSSWADKIKRNKKYEWTKELHYIDIYECINKKYEEEIINKYCKDNCIIYSIKELTKLLKHSNKKNIFYKQENTDMYINNNNKFEILNNEEKLKLLIHFIQDFSQPLHLLGYKRGGNDYKVKILYNGYNKTRNLHYIWDSLIPEYFINKTKYKGEKIYYYNEKDYNKLVDNVFNKNINISCKIYPDKDYLIFEEYYNEKYMEELFNNYMELIIKTLKYIYE